MLEGYTSLGYLAGVGLTPTLYKDPAPWATRLVEDVLPRLKQI